VRDPDAASRGMSSLEKRMVDLLRGSGGVVVSGAEIASSLNVSRTAVWKHVHNLRSKGYCIESLPSRGYRFVVAPDTLTAVELTSGLITQRIGRQVQSIPATDSTNLRAFRSAEDGALEGTVVVADAQTDGKGRLGRRWESPAGVNLYCSIVLRPPIPPVKASQLTFLSAVAVARAIEDVTTLVPQIKWPNDILVHGKKVAGLLNEMSAETDGIHFVILGVGVNINMRAEQFPDDLRHPATSLFLEGGVVVSRVALARAFFMQLDALYDAYCTLGFGLVKDEWLSRSALQGRNVKVSSGTDAIEGTVAGIADDGALLLVCGDGSTERILSGDVSVL
jgi:BirA family transcriptional regulator, biotin operon repressor / biotin---[acetyl-CoA-carboxylase] ligase